jgi:hypothetical protein
LRCLAFGAILFLAACGESAPTPSPTNLTLSPTPEARDRGYITRAEYGDDWPFTVAAGTLSCRPIGGGQGPLLVTFDTGDGIPYALNGPARDFGLRELDETILTDFPSRDGTLPLLMRGIDLCD